MAKLPYAADEKETLTAMLDQPRAAVVAICNGCSDEHLRTRVVGPDSTLRELLDGATGLGHPRPRSD